jgi:hypothetical protein
MMADQLTHEELEQILAAVPRPFDATGLQPVVAPPLTQPDPTMPPVRVPTQAQQPAVAPPVAIVPPQPQPAPQRQFTAISLPSQAERLREHAPGQTSPTISAPGLISPPQPVPAGPAPITMPEKDSPLVEKTAKDQAEQARLQKSGSGISQIFRPVDSEGSPRVDENGNPVHPGSWKKFGGVLAKIGDVAGTTLFPSVMAQIPGTELHHRVLLNQQDDQVNADLEQQKEQAALDMPDETPKIVPTDEGIMIAGRDGKLVPTGYHVPGSSMVTVADPRTGLTYTVPQKDAAHLTGTIIQTGGKADSSDNRLMAALAGHGFKVGSDGQAVPMDESELSPEQRADMNLKRVREDYLGAQRALAVSRTAVENAKNDPTSPAYQFALRHLAMSEQMAQAANTRANAYALNSTVGAFGTDTHGNALPGAMITDDGQTVGSHFQQNVRPTGQERGKADLANSAHEQIQTIREIVHRRPDIFGPATGRTTDFTVWMGSQDPDAQRMRAARTIAGDHLAGVFGGRSEAALNALDSALGHFKDNPAAVDAGLTQLDKANNSFIKAGTVRTVGSRTGNRQTTLATRDQGGQRVAATNGSGQKIRVQIPGHPVGTIPASARQQFLKDNPSAKVVQ